MSRGRRYSFPPIDGFKSKEVATMASILAEAAERVYDVLTYADDTKLHFVPEGSYLSVSLLAKHMAWAEAGWIGKLSGRTAPEDLMAAIGDVSARTMIDMAEGDETAEELSDAIRRLRSEFCVPALSELTDIDKPFEVENGPNTIRQVLSHLIWHWTYHSGQVGITLLQAGHDYEWSFAEPGE